MGEADHGRRDREAVGHPISSSCPGSSRVERPEIKAQFAERGAEAFSGAPEEFDAFVKEQLKVWGADHGCDPRER